MNAEESYLIPLFAGGEIRIKGPFPVSEQDWTQFMTVLDAMRPGLVSAPKGQDPED